MPSNETFDTVLTDHPHRYRARTIESEHLTLDETAEWLRCSTRTLQRLLETGSGPPVVRLSERRLIFRLADLRTWLAQRTHGRATRQRGRPRKSSADEATA
jgi:predicted DNA-binding transcriptional regulator AlpA